MKNLSAFQPSEICLPYDLDKKLGNFKESTKIIQKRAENSTLIPANHSVVQIVYKQGHTVRVLKMMSISEQLRSKLSEYYCLFLVRNAGMIYACRVR